jgi:hypothetical protein
MKKYNNKILFETKTEEDFLLLKEIIIDEDIFKDYDIGVKGFGTTGERKCFVDIEIKKPKKSKIKRIIDIIKEK